MKMLNELLGFVVLSGPLFHLLAFLVVSVIVVVLVSRAGRRRGRHWGRRAALVLLLFAFWDLPPTIGTFWYQCASHAGFTRYRSLDEWKQHNPGVAETLTPYTDIQSTQAGLADRYPLNRRFAWEVETTRLPLRLQRREERIVDMATGEVLARYVDFGTRLEKINWWNPRDYKFWLNHRSCEMGNTMPDKVGFNDYRQSVKQLGRSINGN